MKYYNVLLLCFSVTIVCTSSHLKADFRSWGFPLENNGDNLYWPNYRWPKIIPPKGFFIWDEDYDDALNSPELYPELACNTLGDGFRLPSVVDLHPYAAKSGFLPVLPKENRAYTHSSAYVNGDVTADLIYKPEIEIPYPGDPARTLISKPYGDFSGTNNLYWNSDKINVPRKAGGIMNEWGWAFFLNGYASSSILLDDPVNTNIDLSLGASEPLYQRLVLNISGLRFSFQWYEPLMQYKGLGHLPYSTSKKESYAPSIICIKDIK